jgi:uncharacterized protein YjbI with pentapeptide repeats
MKPELYRNMKTICAVILAFVLLSGATGQPVLATCTNGPGNAIRTLAGTDASIEKIGSSDNNTYILTILTPDPYMYWRTTGGAESGAQSITCFRDYWDSHFSNSELQAVVWGGSTPACAKISSLNFDNESITAVLTRPNRFSTTPSASGDVAIEINRACNQSLPCLGTTDLTGNCYAPFFSTESTAFAASAPGAALNYATFDAVLMPKSNLKATGLSNASFVGANLRGVNLDDAVMVYTDFTDADLTGAHAYGAFVYKTTAPNGEVVNSADALLNGGALTTTTTTPGSLNNHLSLFTLTSANPQQTFSIQFVNSILNDPSEFHAFVFLTLGAGTVHLTVAPESPVELFYGIAGFLGLTPIAAYSAYGASIEKDVLVPDFGFGFIFLVTLPAPAAQIDYPVIMNVDMSLSLF